MTRAHGARGARDDARMTWWCVGVAGALAIGCSACSRAPGEHPAVASRGAPRVPVVIPPPRPFRVARLAETPDRRSMSPAALESSRGTALAASRTEAPARVPALAEPGRFPGAPAEARPAAAEIGLMFRDYARAFNRRDAAAAAAYWSPGAENLDLDTGDVTRGRDAVRDVFAALFAEERAGRLGIDIESIRLVRPDVAVVDAVLAVSFTDDDRAATAPRRRLSAVVVRHDEHWQLDSVREAGLTTAPDAATASPPSRPRRHLEPLAFLVGTWEGSCAGATVTTRCAWAADDAFLVRTHLVSADVGAATPTPGDRGIPALLVPGSAGTREISELVTYDAQRDRIRSWLFTSQGRFAEGEWSRSGDRWIVEIVGKGADAGSSARMELERIGPGECVVRCSADGLADVCPPACGFVRVD